MSNKIRWFYMSTTLDLSIYDILLSSCKYVIFDKREISFTVDRVAANDSIASFIMNNEVKDHLTNIIKDKKNRHIVYMLRGKDPLELKQQIMTLAKEVSPSSKFYFSLVCDDPEYIRSNDFYSVYILNNGNKPPHHIQ